MSATTYNTSATAQAAAPAAAVAPAARAAEGSPTPLRTTLAGFRRELMWVAIFGCLVNLLMLTPTLYMLQVFDRVMVSSSEYTLAALSMLAVVLFLAMGFADWLRSRLLVRAGNRFDHLLHKDVFRVSFEARLSASAGSASSPLQPMADLMNLRQFLTGNGVFALIDTPWTVIYIGVLFLMHPWLGWMGVAFTVVMLAVAIVGARLSAPHHARAGDAGVEANAYLQTKLRNAEAAQAMGMAGSLRRHWLAIHERMLGQDATALEVSQRVQAATKFVQYLQQSLILALGALLAIDGKISVGAMIVCNALLGNALRPIGLVVGSWKQFVDARDAYRRLNGLFAEHPAQATPGDDPPLRGEVELQGLVATVPGREVPILQGLDALFRPGEVIAVVGPSGAGKSTLARCIVGIWPHTQGCVLLDGKPIDEWSRESLGPQIGYLPQDIEMFDGTIAENIARFYEVPGEAVIAAARATGIHDMVLRMPKGYDTPMGEGGAMLSGGQRQRIGLARAVFGQPKLVVLDEPNANLDDAGEAALLKTVRALKAAGSTVLMVVHQPQMLAAADRVLMLEAGRISRIVPVAGPGTAPTPTVVGQAA